MSHENHQVVLQIGAEKEGVLAAVDLEVLVVDSEDLGGGGVFRDSYERERDSGIDVELGFQSVTTLSRAAQNIRFVLNTPVSLKSGHSAALPAFSTEVPARIVSVWNGKQKSKIPSRAIEINNETSSALVPGPVTIVRQGEFAGDAILPRLDLKEKTMIKFGVDQPMQVVHSNEEFHPVGRQIELEKGIFRLTTQEEKVHRYYVENKDSDSRILRVQHLRTPDTPPVQSEDVPLTFKR